MFDPSRRDEFSRVILVHLDEVYRYACRLTRDVARAEDLTQETFLQAWRSFDRFAPGSHARAWLYGIFHNVLGRDRRQAGRERHVVDLEQLPPHVLVHEPLLSRVLDLATVERAFAGLSEAAREIVLLADLEGLAYREIADVLGVPIGTVMSRLNRARKQLRAAVTSHVHGARESASGE